MSISNAINIAVSGLRASQNGLGVVSSNIANSETEGYTKKTLQQYNLTASDRSIGVRSDNISRSVNDATQALLRSSAAENTYAGITADYLQRLDQAFGAPGSINALDTNYNKILSSLQSLATSPNDFSIQTQTANDLRVFTQQLNSLSETIQQLRREADASLENSSENVNSALAKLVAVNNEIISAGGRNGSAANLLDERDRLVDEVSQIIDVRVSYGRHDSVQLTTRSGNALFNGEAFRLEYDVAGTINAQVEWDADPAQSDLDSVRLVSGGTFSIDLFSANGLQTGALKAYHDLRDDTLVTIQRQLDEMAAAIAHAVSNVDVEGTAIAGGQSLDLNNLQNGNEVSLTFTETAGPTTHNVTIVKVSDPSLLPLANDTTADPNDVVIGIDFSGGPAAAAASLQTALNGVAAGLTVAEAGGVFSITGGAAATVDSLSASITQTSLLGNNAAPIFVDSATGNAYTGALEGNGAKKGLAARLAVNEDVLADPSLLTRTANGNTSAGSTDRVNFMIERLQTTSFTFHPSSGIGNSTNPYQSDIGQFVRSVISYQGSAANNAQSEAQRTNIVFTSYQAKMTEDTAVNVDEEMAQLVKLEQAYAANARVMSIAQEMIDALLRI